MNQDSQVAQPASAESVTTDSTPILLIPYMWIGDFVRCHSVIKVLRSRFPHRPIDVLTTTLCAPLLDYMPEVRKGIVADLPRKRLALKQHKALADRLRAEGYGQALVMPRTWKAALAPCLAAIPQRTGFMGEFRFGILNDMRNGERALPRMVDRCGALALPKGAPVPKEWPLPGLIVPAAEVAAWQKATGLTQPALAMAPGAVGPSKRWPVAAYTNLARMVGQRGLDVWVLGGPNEAMLGEEIKTAGEHVHNLTGPDLRNAILALAAAAAAVSNDSGLLHVAAALGTASIGIFGPTSPWHWAPLNPLAAIMEPPVDPPCRPCHKPVCRFGHHRCMQDISVTQVTAALERTLTTRPP